MKSFSRERRIVRVTGGDMMMQVLYNCSNRSISFRSINWHILLWRQKSVYCFESMNFNTDPSILLFGVLLKEL